MMAGEGYSFALYETAAGWMHLGYEKSSLLRLHFVEEAPTHRGEKSDLTEQVYAEIQEYFGGQRRHFEFDYSLRGTEFQRCVWHALCDIPYGETRSYQQIAQCIANPKACRAVGMANNKNPLLIVVPCHRVVGSRGDLVGYSAGLSQKAALLDLEANLSRL